MQPSRCAQSLRLPSHAGNPLTFPPSRILRYNGGGSKPNITGFEMREFLRATGSQRYDPWGRAYVSLHPPFPFP
jgi:hypothetical protein